MFKTGFAFCFLFLLFAGTLRAQQLDSLRRDSLKLKRAIFVRDSTVRDSIVTDSIRRASIKVDTNLLNQYRIDPRLNAIPQLARPIQVRPEQVPVTLLDYKVSYWHRNVIFGLNFSQAGFSDNWSGGGVNSFAVNGNLDYKLEYNKSPFDYTSELVLLYGKSKNKDQIPRKTNDRIFWDNKIATQLSKSWYFFGSLDFESQFDVGYQYQADGSHFAISRFMSPGYITESIGFEYKPKPFFDLRIGTGTARQTLVLDRQISANNLTDSLHSNANNNYGVLPGRTFKNELAFQIVALFDKDLAKNLHLNTRYAVFIPYDRSVQNIDHRIDATLSAKITRLISVTFTGTALYDKDTKPGIQSSESLNMGLLYKFP